MSLLYRGFPTWGSPAASTGMLVVPECSGMKGGLWEGRNREMGHG